MAEEYLFMGNWFLLSYKALHIFSGGNGRKEKSFRDSGDDRLRSYPNNRFQGLKSLRKCLWGCQGKRRDLEPYSNLEAMRWTENLYGWSKKRGEDTKHLIPAHYIFQARKYRLVSQLESFWAFQFFPIIAVIVSHRMWAIHDQTERKKAGPCWPADR